LLFRFGNLPNAGKAAGSGLHILRAFFSIPPLEQIHGQLQEMTLLKRLLPAKNNRWLFYKIRFLELPGKRRAHERAQREPASQNFNLGMLSWRIHRGPQFNK
jgi:hypothetical protein